MRNDSVGNSDSESDNFSDRSCQILFLLFMLIFKILDMDIFDVFGGAKTFEKINQTRELWIENPCYCS